MQAGQNLVEECTYQIYNTIRILDIIEMIQPLVVVSNNM